MTTPGKYALAIYRGDTYRWRFILWADDEKTEPFDLSGVTAAAAIDATLLTCSMTAPNIIDVVLPADVSAGLTAGKGAWDLELTYADGDVVTVLAGSVKVTADVTHAELAA
jgi:hypothetical protein